MNKEQSKYSIGKTVIAGIIIYVACTFITVMFSIVMSLVIPSILGWSDSKSFYFMCLIPNLILAIHYTKQWRTGEYSTSHFVKGILIYSGLVFTVGIMIALEVTALLAYSIFKINIVNSVRFNAIYHLLTNIHYI